MSSITIRTLTLARNASARTLAPRAFSTATLLRAEGETRGGGAVQGDQFSKREKANEDYYVRQQEAQKLEQLKKKIADAEAQLAKDKKDAEDMGKK